MNDIAFWNSQDITTYFATKPADPRIVAFLDNYDRPANAIALDLGCGGGRHSELLADRGFEVAAVDVNPGMISATKNRLEHLNLSADIKEGTITRIPYEEATFDIVVTTGVLHQAISTEEYDKAIEELARVTKPGGYVLLNIFTNKAWDDTYTVVSNDGYTVHTKEKLAMTLLPKPIFISMMQNHGLKLFDDQGEDTKIENTGPRSVYRAFFLKSEAAQ